MLCFDFVQPSLDGHPLAIVRYRVGAGERMTAVGMVRCPPELAAQFRGWSPRMKACLLSSYPLQARPRSRFVMRGVTYHASSWDQHKLIVLDNRTLLLYPGQPREYDHPSFSSHMDELLQKPVWVATGEAWALHQAMRTRQPATARVRI